MKKQLILLMMILLPMAANADSWDGVSSDKSWYDENATEFFIYNAAQLKGLADLVNNDGIFFDGKTVYLQNDIDLANKHWEPIGFWYQTSFNGIFDGQDHAINNMYITTDQYIYKPISCVGFFGKSRGSIINLEVQGVVDLKREAYFSSPSIGGVVGKGEDIINVRSNIVINTWSPLSSTYIGNVAGYTHNMSKINSEGEVHFYESAPFSSQSYYGGIVGHVQQLSECFSNVRIVIPSDGTPMMSAGFIGGLAGEATSISDAIFTVRFEVYEKNKNRMTSSGCISGNVFSLNNVICAPSYYYCDTEKTIFKGLVVPPTSQATVTNVYYQDTYAQGTNVVGTSVSEDYLKSGTSLDGFDKDIWKFTAGSYPRLKALIPTYTIHSPLEHGTIAYCVKEGEDALIEIKAEQGWAIEKVFVNQTDVTAQMSGNRLIISDIQEKKEIFVVYQQLSSGVKSPQAVKAFSIYSTSDGFEVTGVQTGKSIAVYDLKGTELVRQSSNGKNHFALPKGLYIITANGTSKKVSF